MSPENGDGLPERGYPSVPTAAEPRSGDNLRPTQPQAVATTVPPRPRHQVDLDLDALRTAGYLVPGTPRNQLMDEWRSIKRPLLAKLHSARAARSDARENLIMITSALAGEGKTFSSINLAMSLAAEVDQQVMLVDADIARTSATRQLGIELRPGLLDLLADPNLKLVDVELSTNIANLTFLPAGTPNDHANELFGSLTMDRLLRNLHLLSTRIVVFDSPPLLPAVESRVLAPQMGQILLVINAGKTSQSLVQQALDLIESCPVVAIMLNCATAHSGAPAYGYYAY